MFEAVFGPESMTFLCSYKKSHNEMFKKVNRVQIESEPQRTKSLSFTSDQRKMFCLGPLGKVGKEWRAVWLIWGCWDASRQKVQWKKNSSQPDSQSECHREESHTFYCFLWGTEITTSVCRVLSSLNTDPSCGKLDEIKEWGDEESCTFLCAFK